MWSKQYRGYFIQGYCHKDECRVVSADAVVIGLFRNLRAAQRAIRRILDARAAGKIVPVPFHRYPEA